MQDLLLLEDILLWVVKVSLFDVRPHHTVPLLIILLFLHTSKCFVAYISVMWDTWGSLERMERWKAR